MPWLSKTQLIANLNSLVNQHANVTVQSIGKTVQNNDLWMYRIGVNPSVKLLIDGGHHGMEGAGSHTVYFLCQWLLGGSAEANAILNGLQVLLIPIVNYDNCSLPNIGDPIYRKNAHGVDLNRNYVRGWSYNPDTASEYYAGPNAASEPETQAMRTLFTAEQPKVYMSLHDFGGNPTTNGDIRPPTYGSTTYTTALDAILAQYRSIVQSFGFTPWVKSANGAYGGSRDDGYRNGDTLSFCCEQTGGSNETYTYEYDLLNKLPHLKALTLAVSALYGVPLPQQHYVFRQWQDGDTNPTKVINV